MNNSTNNKEGLAKLIALAIFLTVFSVILLASFFIETYNRGIYSVTSSTFLFGSAVSIFSLCKVIAIIIHYMMGY